MGRGQPIEDREFGRLKVVKLNIDKSTKRRKYYDCICSCGKLKTILRDNLVSGKTQSCGCLQKESAVLSINRNRPYGEFHGESKTRLYSVYRNMINRCVNKNVPEFIHYGGRRIQVCSEWRRSYVNFKNWAIINGYKDGLTIDRINNNGNYEPNNCRWVDMKTQSNNRRTNKMIEINGIVKTQAQWCEEYGISRQVFANNLKKGLKNEDLLTHKRKLRKSTGEQYIYFRDSECTKYIVSFRLNGKSYQSKTLYDIKEAIETRNQMLARLKYEE